MKTQSVFRVSWICVLLFSFGTGAPPQSQVSGGSGSAQDSGASGPAPRFYGGFGSGHGHGSQGSGQYHTGGPSGSGSSGSGGSHGSGSSGSGSGGSHGSGSGSGGSHGSGSGSGGSSGSGSGSFFGSGGFPGFGSGSGSGGSSGSSFSSLGSDLSRFIATLLGFRVNRPGFISQTPSFQRSPAKVFRQTPTTRVVQSSGGYKRARDSQSLAKYFEDALAQMGGFGRQGKKLSWQ
ncbi:uncharacterized protein ACNS7B_022665 [Menidia menidia]